jgi:hypothetical protein
MKKATEGKKCLEGLQDTKDTRPGCTQNSHQGQRNGSETNWENVVKFNESSFEICKGPNDIVQQERKSPNIFRCRI